MNIIIGMICAVKSEHMFSYFSMNNVVTILTCNRHFNDAYFQLMFSLFMIKSYIHFNP